MSRLDSRVAEATTGTRPAVELPSNEEIEMREGAADEAAGRLRPEAP